MLVTCSLHSRTLYTLFKDDQPTGLTPNSWDFQPCYVYLHYLFHHLFPLALRSPIGGVVS